MNKNLITLSQFNSLAACASSGSAEVASATSDVIKELAEQIVMTGDGISINVSNSVPSDSSSYWLQITDTEEEESA